MKILLANKFFYIRGGAERWIFEVDKLLRDHGHETIHFSMSGEHNAPSLWSKYFVSQVSYQQSLFSPASFKAILRMFHSGEVKRAVERLIEKSRPDVAILGNVYHQLGPTLISTLAQHGIPMVMMLHDYKVVCPSYLLFRKGRPCEKCAHGSFFWSAIHGCGGSYGHGLILALESYWQKNFVKSYSKINTFIAPSRFLSEKSREMGFPFTIHYVPNFVSIPHNQAKPLNGKAIGFCGRLSPEKGLEILLEAASLITDIPVRVAGTGPSFEKLKQTSPSNVTFVGHLNKQSLMQEMLSWRAAVIPSLWYENCPYGILEAFALGLPIIGSDLGGIKEMIGGYGAFFQAGNAKMLAREMRELWENPGRCVQLGKAAREFVGKEYSPEEFMSVITPILEKATD